MGMAAMPAGGRSPVRSDDHESVLELGFCNHTAYIMELRETVAPVLFIKGL